MWSVAHLTLADPGARGSPDLLTGCIQWGGEGNSSKPHGWAGALQPCPMHTDTPGMGTPLHHPHTREQPNVGSDQYLAPGCVARFGGPPAGEKIRCLNKSNRQTTSSPVLDVCLQALKPCYCPVLKQHMLHSPIWHAVCFRHSQLTNQIKSPCSLNLHKARTFFNSL